MEYHQPVMLNESIEGLAINPKGIYVDVTFGGGGHSRAILEVLKEGKLFAFDQDPDAKKNADQINDPSFTFVAANFRYMSRFLKLYGVELVDGILADLGVSSYQFDQPERGFSIRHDALLDMRMDKKNPLSAFKVVNEYDERNLHKILGQYGEVKNAKSLARHIVSQREKKKIETVNDLKELVSDFTPKHKEFKYLAKVFQALRIEVNDELGALRVLLEGSVDKIKKGGRLVVIAYHSLEDRMVKNFINKGDIYGKMEKDFYGNLIRPFEPVNRKPLTPGEEELKINNRARSAKLRIGEKL